MIQMNTYRLKSEPPNVALLSPKTSSFLYQPGTSEVAYQDDKYPNDRTLHNSKHTETLSQTLMQPILLDVQFWDIYQT